MGLTGSDQKTATSADHGKRVQKMFAGIARRYDLLNHLLSANTDRRWRRIVASRLGQKMAAGDRVLDVACGTGDLSIQLFETTGARIMGLDFCRPMLEIGARSSAVVLRCTRQPKGQAV